MLQRNVILRLLYPLLQRSEESGIYGRWERYNRLYTDFITFLLPFGLEKGHSNVGGLVLAYHFAKPFPFDMTSAPKRVFMSEFKFFIKLMLYIFSVSFALFFVEFSVPKVIFIWKSWKQVSVKSFGTLKQWLTVGCFNHVRSFLSEILGQIQCAFGALYACIHQ